MNSQYSFETPSEKPEVDIARFLVAISEENGIPTSKLVNTIDNDKILGPMKANVCKNILKAKKKKTKNNRQPCQYVNKTGKKCTTVPRGDSEYCGVHKKILNRKATRDIAKAEKKKKKSLDKGVVPDVSTEVPVKTNTENVKKVKKKKPIMVENVEKEEAVKVKKVKKKEAVKVKKVKKKEAVKTKKVNKVKKEEAVKVEKVKKVKKVNKVKKEEAVKTKKVEKKEAVKTKKVNKVKKEEAVKVENVEKVEKEEAVKTKKVEKKEAVKTKKVEKKEAVKVKKANKVNKVKKEEAGQG